MELTELVSPHIAVPVIGVVVCAIMVFAFGFRSPVQPPSFSFEEEKKSRRRSRQSKSKGTINGYVAANEQASEVVLKTTPKSTKEVKAASSPKVDLNESKNIPKRELKQDIKGDKKEKQKKETVKEELKLDVGKKNKIASAKKDTEDDGEWTIIQVSKKSKKQKPSRKKDNKQAEPAFEPESEPETAPTPTFEEAETPSAALTSDNEKTSSPQVTKIKKRKEKLTEKSNKAEEKEESSTIPVHEKPEPTSHTATQIQDQGDSKRKKSKKDKKSSAVDAADSGASVSENILQDVASASGKTEKKELSKTPVSAPASTEQTKPNPGKKHSKGKENIQEEKFETAANLVPKQVEKPVESIKKDANIQIKQVEKPVESIKKDANIQLKQVEKPVESIKKDANIQLKQVEKPVESIKKVVDKKKAKSPSKALKVEPEIPTVAESKPTADQATPEQAAVGISFDEIGESWQEAAPKSKKKKPRKDN